MFRLSAIPSKGSVIIRQKPSPMVFVFMPETTITLKHDDPLIGRVRDFHVPATCWQYDPRTNAARIRVVESTEGRIMLKQFVLGNVHDNEAICWGRNAPKDLRDMIQTFWDAPFNDDLTHYSGAGDLEVEEFRRNQFPNHPDYDRYSFLLHMVRDCGPTAGPDIFPQSYADFLSKRDRLLRHINTRVSDLMALRGQASEYNAGVFPSGLEYAELRNKIEGRNGDDLGNRVIIIDSTVAKLRAKSEAINTQNDWWALNIRQMRRYWQTYYRAYFSGPSASEERARLSANQYLSDASIYNFEQIKEFIGDDDWVQRVANYHMRAESSAHRHRIFDNAYDEYDREHRVSIRQRWWSEGEWEMVGEAEDYTTFVMGTERQMYDSLEGFGFVSGGLILDGGSSFMLAMQTLPEETWEHYGNGFIFPVFRTKLTDVFAAIVATKPFLIEKDPVYGQWNWKAYDQESRDFRKEIEGVFA